MSDLVNQTAVSDVKRPSLDLSYGAAARASVVSSGPRTSSARSSTDANAAAAIRPGTPASWPRPTLVAIALLAADVLSFGALMGLEHVAMLLRLDEYTSHATHTHDAIAA
jgi:hypothetical protein